MHICFICNEYPPYPHGGIGSAVHTLGRALVKLGHRVSVVGIYPKSWSGISYTEGVQIIRLPHSRIPTLRFTVHTWRLLETIRKLHKESPIDIIETNELGFAFFPKASPWVKLIRLQGGHHYYSVMLGKKPRFWRSFQERMSFRNADAVCSVSQILAETTRKLLDLEELKIKIIPNPVDTQHFSPNEKIDELNGLIMFVGTLVQKKGITNLIDAMPAIRRAVPNAQLWVAGRDTLDAHTGKTMSQMLMQRSTVDVQNCIRFLGVVPNEKLPNLLSLAQVLVFPSDMEAFGIVFIEGMAMGKPTVVGNNGAGPEIVQHEKTGLLCNPHEPQSIAEQVIRLLNDRQLRRQLGDAARVQAIEKYSIDSLVKENESFYEFLLTSHTELGAFS